MMSKKIIPFFFFILIIWLYRPAAVQAVSCSPSQNGTVFTVSSDCSFPETIDGVDAGAGTENTAKLEVSNSTLTIGNTQTIAVGSFEAVAGGEIIIPEGSAIEVGKPLWLTDADTDGYPATTTKIISVSQPAGGVRASAVVNPGNPDGNDSQRCADADTYQTAASTIFNTPCKTCSGGVAVNRPVGAVTAGCATTCNGSGLCGCWKAGGVCDEGCASGSIATATVYTTCGNGSACEGTNCWTLSGVCDAGCAYSTVTSPGSINTSCSASTCQRNFANETHTHYPYYVGSNTVAYYSLTGSCNGGGSGTCYKNGSNSTYLETNISCDVSNSNCRNLGSFMTSYGTCSWAAGTYPKEVSGAVTKYTGSGTCNADGTGTCYKLTGASSYYIANGPACPTGGGTCTSGTYYDSTQCVFE